MASVSLLEKDHRLLLDRRHRVTLAEYHRMAEAGVFGVDPHIELLEGMIVARATENSPHVLATDLVQSLLTRLVPPGFYVSMGNPVAIAERDSEPEPDAAIVRGTPRDYTARRRTARDAAVVIEITDTSYDLDSRVKTALYGAAGVPIYWLLDLNRQRLEIHSDPSLDGYRRRVEREADALVPILLDGVEVAQFPLREILP